METISRLPRRLTQLYSDTKTSCDAVLEQDAPETQPEVTALHRKYRIQKDRLIAWGLEWSDNTKGKQGDIDESVERAGLTETVTSVLGTIKDILDEAERMHPPAVAAGAKSLSGEKSRPAASDLLPWAASDRSRYEDLAKDLTTSIDILYDLSRTRRAQQEGARSHSPLAKVVSEPLKPSNTAKVFSTSEYSASDVTLINPATIPVTSVLSTIPSKSSLPPKLHASDLVLPEEEPPPYESVGKSSIRVIGRLRTRHSSTNPWKTDGSKTVETAVLVEYATYDPAYRSTEVPPPTDRLETLLSILAKLASDQSFHGTLTCLGYFEDPKQPRFGLVFELPSFVYSGASDSHKPLEELRPVTLLSVLQTGSKSLHNSNSATPPLEDRFRLAFTLALTFNKIHGDDFVHKDVNSSNILVFRKNRRQSANSRALQYALRSPVICSFDLFSDYDIEPSNTMPPLNIYRHPEDPKFTGEKGKHYGPQFDLYSLGLILLEVGLWQPLADLWKPKYTLTDFKQRVEDVYIRRLASKCGTAYMQVVRDCFWAADRIASGAESLQNFSQLYNRILIRLQRCCLLDEVEPSFEWGELSSAAGAAPSSSPLKRKTASQIQTTDAPSSPSYRSAKRWALEKGSHVLERSKSLTKPSPKSSPNLSSLSRHGSRSSQHSVRKSLSQLMSPKEELPQPMEWQRERDPLEESGTFADTPPDSQERGDLAAAGVIPRAWRASQTESFGTPPKSMSSKDYKDKITMIQKLWRQRKQNRTNTVSALLTDGIRHWPQAALGYPSYPSYPTPEPEDHSAKSEKHEQHVTRSIQIQRHMDTSSSPKRSSLEIHTNVEAPPRPKLRLHPVIFSDEILDEWHQTMLPRLERVIERALRESDETVSIDLVAIGETQEKARPTIFVTCSSIAKVQAVLQRKFKYDGQIYDLKVRRGKVRRSKMNRSNRRTRLPHRSMMNTDSYDGDMLVMNPYHQQRPVCGASIGAFNGAHLPPVSYGGVILVDNEPLGMSVHHLLDAPSDDESDDEEAMSPGPNDAVLSSANSAANPWLMGMGTQPGVQLSHTSSIPMWDLEISDDEATKSDDDDYQSYHLSSDSEFDTDEESENGDDLAASTTSKGTVGDIDGITLGEGQDIRITQPAIDDVDDDFFPCEEDRDEDHLASHELGYVHASSGIRRWKKNGILHEIDWALLKVNEDRLQPYNLVQGGRKFCFSRKVEPDQLEISTKLQQPVSRRHYTPEEDEYPNGVASADSLGGLNVHCFGRTTGLQGGMVGPAMSSVRIYRRKTFSRSWHVAGGFGVGGDSGAWVVQNGTHRVVGHVLAWCERNHIAYICPMEVLLEDIKRTLGAKRVYLPGSAEEAKYLARSHKHALSGGEDSRVDRLGKAVEGLGIVDSGVDMKHAAVSANLRTTGKTCYNCGQIGHIASTCPFGSFRQSKPTRELPQSFTRFSSNLSGARTSTYVIADEHRSADMEKENLGLEKSAKESTLDGAFANGRLLQHDIEMMKSRNYLEHPPGADEDVENVSVGPSASSMEQTLHALFAEILEIDAHDLNDHTDWNVLGGDSMQAFRLVRAAKQRNIGIEFSDVFKYPRPGVLAEHAVWLSTERPEERSTRGDEVATTGTSGETAKEPSPGSDRDDFEAHLFTEIHNMDDKTWKDIQTRLPESWMWDVDYHTTHSIDDRDHGCWTCTPSEPDDPKNFPLTIANNPVVLPVEHQWPPMAGVNPPPDPRPSAPVDCAAELPLAIVRDILITFEGSVGFYLLINGLLQIIIPEGFDTTWASSHLPHKYGGLKVCYIPQTVEATVFPGKTETMKAKSSQASQTTSMSSFFRPSKASHFSLAPSLQLNDFIEARSKSSHKKEKFAGRIGLKVSKGGDPYLVMSTHIITEAILAKSHIIGFFSRNRDRFEKLDDDWNEHVEIWAGNEKIGTIAQTFDQEADLYPSGFSHDITLIKPTQPSSTTSISSPIPNLGWLSKSSWHTLRQRTSALKILGPTESNRVAKTLKSHLPSEALIVGEGIFLNQKASSAFSLKEHDEDAWKSLVSRAVLYRVAPDFDPPNGYSGVALYAEGTREDGSEGPGIVGFQSFVQRSGHVQNFDMEGGALEKRLRLGRVAFYGAFQVPDDLKREYSVV